MILYTVVQLLVIERIYPLGEQVGTSKNYRSSTEKHILATDEFGISFVFYFIQFIYLLHMMNFRAFNSSFIYIESGLNALENVCINQDWLLLIYLYTKLFSITVGPL